MGPVLPRVRFILDHRWSPRHMSEYIDGDIDAPGRARIERHAGDCPDCRELLASLQAMVATLGSLPGRPAESVAGAVLAGIHERLGAVMTGLPDTPTASDEALVERARGGDMAAFEELVMRHADALYGSLRRFGLDDDEAGEVAQETFLRAWRSLGGFEGRSRFFTWLYRIGFNEAQRKLARRPPAGAVVSTEDRPLDEIADPSRGPAGRTEDADLRTALAAGLRELPPALRAPVVLRDVEGLSTQEAASVLDLGEAAFKSRLHRGRMALRTLMGPRLRPSG